jgi:hypothetical protein
MLRVIGGAGHVVIGRAAPREGRPVGLALAACPRGRQRLRVKRDFACTLTGHFPPVLVVLPGAVTLELEGPAPYPGAARPPAWNAAALCQG